MSKSLEGVIVKKAYQQESYTEQHILEIARCADPVTGPAYFMSNYFYIQHPTRGGIKYNPYEYQSRLIDTYHNYRFSISLMPRQTGINIAYHNKYPAALVDFPVCLGIKLIENL